MDAHFKEVEKKQLELAKKLYSKDSIEYVEKLKAKYELLVGYLCTKHTTYDSVFYIQDCGSLGFLAIKFYNDSTDFRIGSYQVGLAEAYTEALCYM